MWRRKSRWKQWSRTTSIISFVANRSYSTLATAIPVTASYLVIERGTIPGPTGSLVSIAIWTGRPDPIIASLQMINILLPSIIFRFENHVMTIDPQMIVG
jgi:hypothetical protein